MILTLFLQYFNCFGEVIFSHLVYFFKMKYFSGEKIIKTKILVSLFDEKSNMKIRENPQLSPRVLELLRIYRGFVKMQ